MHFQELEKLMELKLVGVIRIIIKGFFLKPFFFFYLHYVKHRSRIMCSDLIYVYKYERRCECEYFNDHISRGSGILILVIN